MVYVRSEDIETSWSPREFVGSVHVGSPVVVGKSVSLKKMASSGVVTKLVERSNVIGGETEDLKQQDLALADAQSPVVGGELLVIGLDQSLQESVVRVQSVGPRNNITNEEEVNNDAGFLYSTAVKAKIALLNSMIDYDDGAGGRSSPRVRIGARKKLGQAR